MSSHVVVDLKGLGPRGGVPVPLPSGRSRVPLTTLLCANVVVPAAEPVDRLWGDLPRDPEPRKWRRASEVLLEARALRDGLVATYGRA